MAERIPSDSIDDYFSDYMFSEQEVCFLGNVDSVDCQQALAAATAEILEIASSLNSSVGESASDDYRLLTVDLTVTKLLREDSDPSSDEINLDAATLCMLVTSRDGAWQQRPI